VSTLYFLICFDSASPPPLPGGVLPEDLLLLSPPRMTASPFLPISYPAAGRVPLPHTKTAEINLLPFSLTFFARAPSPFPLPSFLVVKRVLAIDPPPPLMTPISSPAMVLPTSKPSGVPYIAPCHPSPRSLRRADVLRLTLTQCAHLATLFCWAVMKDLSRLPLPFPF